jgi:hypothetical protein
MITSEFTNKLVEDAIAINGQVNSSSLRAAFENMPLLKKFNIVDGQHEALIRLSNGGELTELIESGISEDAEVTVNLLYGEEEVKAYQLQLIRIWFTAHPDNYLYYSTIELK